MPLSKSNLERVRVIAGEVLALVLEVDHERQRVETRVYVNREWEHCIEERETHPGSTRASAALKRRSMDLTRALADLRRSQ